MSRLARRSVGALLAGLVAGAATEGRSTEPRLAADVTEAVREHLERAHAGEWTRFDLVDVRWTNGEPSPGTVLGPLSGDADPTVNGSIALYAEVQEPGAGLARLPLSISVRPWGRVPVAARAVARGAALGPEDFRMEERPVSELRGARAADTSSPEVLQARRDLRPGDPLTTACVEVAPLVISGNRVVIRYQAPGIELRTTGIARRSGRRGETIQVVNLDSRRTLEARVSGPGVVEVGP